MSKGVTVGLGAVVLAAGGITAGLLSGEGSPSLDADGGVQANEVRKNIEEYQARPRAFVAANGRRIRVVGVEGESTTVQDSDLGRVVDVPEIPDDGICPFVIHARVREVEKKRWPDIDGIEWGMRPVQISGSEKDGDWGWNGYVKGQAECEKIVSHDSYLGSTMAELLALSDEWKARLLRVKGTCEDEEKQKYTCWVAWGDLRAIPDSEIRFPHQLAGRADINLVAAKSDGTPEDRTPEPEGGWGAEISDDPKPVDGGVGEVERP